MRLFHLKDFFQFLLIFLGLAGPIGPQGAQGQQGEPGVCKIIGNDDPDFRYRGDLDKIEECPRGPQGERGAQGPAGPQECFKNIRLF